MFKSTTLWKPALGAIALAAGLGLSGCGGGDGDDGRASNSSARGGGAVDPFNQPNSVFERFAVLTETEACLSPNRRGAGDSQIAECRANQYQLQMTGAANRANAWRFTLYDYTPANGAWLDPIINVFKFDDEAFRALVSQAWRGQPPATGTVGDYNLLMRPLNSMLGDDGLFISIRLQADIDAAERTIAESPITRSPSEINAKNSATRLAALLLSEVDWSSADRGMLVYLAKFNNEQKFAAVEGNEFDEGPYFQELVTRWTAIADGLDRTGFTSTYSIPVGRYDTQGQRFQTTARTWQQPGVSAAPITIGRGEAGQVGGELVDSSGGRLTLANFSWTTRMMTLSQSVTLSELPMPPDDGRRVVESFPQRGDQRMVSLTIVYDVTAIETRERSGNTQIIATLTPRSAFIPMPDGQNIPVEL